jgi:dihydrofolate synthase/folylpolyglutamate synthase
MNYQETISYLYGLERFGIKLDLSNIISLTDRLGNPQIEFPSIHIAGSNGKGSVAAMLQSILSLSGYRTGLYTSPHLVDYRERIRIGDELIDKDFIVDFVNDLKEEIDQNGYTFFEVTTALAFSYFAKHKINMGILETGMGGRLDATNIATPLISIITNISLEHTEHLGTTLAQIAFEKAGIIKNGIPTITAVDDSEALQVIEDICGERESPLSIINPSVFISDAKFPPHPIPLPWGERGNNEDIRIHKLSVDQTVFDFGPLKNLKLNLSGRHQVTNASLAIFATKKLKEMGWKINRTAIRDGLKNVNWRGRLEVARDNPLTLLDVAHNPVGIKTLIEALEEFFPEKKIIFIFGVMADKDYPLMLKEICWKAKFILLTKPDYKRAADPELLEKVLIDQNKPYEILPQVKQAYIFALKNAKSEDVICITGSHFTVGEFLS